MIFQPKSSYSLDQLILDQNQKIIIVHFFRELYYNYKISQKIITITISKFKKSFILINLDCEKIFDLDNIYELAQNFCIIFFYKNKNLKIDGHNGDTNKIKNMDFSKNHFFYLLKKLNLCVKKGKLFVLL